VYVGGRKVLAHNVLDARRKLTTGEPPNFRPIVNAPVHLTTSATSSNTIQRSHVSLCVMIVTYMNQIRIVSFAVDYG
jgi:hypothetical protein